LVDTSICYALRHAACSSSVLGPGSRRVSCRCGWGNSRRSGAPPRPPHGRCATGHDYIDAPPLADNDHPFSAGIDDDDLRFPLAGRLAHSWRVHHAAKPWQLGLGLGLGLGFDQLAIDRSGEFFSWGRRRQCSHRHDSAAVGHHHNCASHYHHNRAHATTDHHDDRASPSHHHHDPAAAAVGIWG